MIFNKFLRRHFMLGFFKVLAVAAVLVASVVAQGGNSIIGTWVYKDGRSVRFAENERVQSFDRNGRLITSQDDPVMLYGLQNDTVYIGSQRFGVYSEQYIFRNGVLSCVDTGERLTRRR
jgi:hypothetical protein